jgi:hypothetical protein
MVKQRWVNQISRIVTGVLVAATVSNGGAVRADEAIEVNLVPSAQSVTQTMAQTASRALTSEQYLFGKSQTAEQIGSAYMVFEVVNQTVVGAFYMPHSSFDCFQGQFRGNALNLAVVDSYDGISRPYTLAVHQNAYVASNSSVTVSVEIEGFYSISSLSDNDRRILETCKADLQ